MGTPLWYPVPVCAGARRFALPSGRAPGATAAFIPNIGDVRNADHAYSPQYG